MGNPEMADERPCTALTLAARFGCRGRSSLREWKGRDGYESLVQCAQCARGTIIRRSRLMARCAAVLRKLNEMDPATDTASRPRRNGNMLPAGATGRTASVLTRRNSPTTRVRRERESVGENYSHQVGQKRANAWALRHARQCLGVVPGPLSHSHQDAPGNGTAWSGPDISSHVYRAVDSEMPKGSPMPRHVPAWTRRIILTTIGFRL